MEKNYSSIVDFFIKYGFYTVPPTLRLLSNLPPTDRVKILTALVPHFTYEVNLYNKLSMALLKNGEYNKAFEVLADAYKNKYISADDYSFLKQKIISLDNKYQGNFPSSKNYAIALNRIQDDMSEGFDSSWDSYSIILFNKFKNILIDFCKSQL